MNTQETGILITIIIQALYFAHKMGVIEKTISSLEIKQDKHNNLIERMVHVEDSVKSAHKRIDGVVENA